MSDINEDVELETPSGENPEEFFGLTIDEVIPDEEMRNSITDYLTKEIDQVQTDREDYEQSWEKWRRQRLARPEEKSKNYPWPNASNQAVPLAASNTNSLFATTKDKFGSRRPLINISTEEEDLKQNANALTRLVDKLMESQHHINIRKKNLTILYDLVSLGTQFVKVPWNIKKWNFKRDGKEVEKVIMDSPDVIPIPIDDFFCKLHLYDIQTAPWIAIRTRYQEYELKQKEANGIFENVDQILSHNEREIPEWKEEILDEQEQDSTITEDASEYEIYETYLFWDVDDDGMAEDIKVFFHKDAGVILRAEFNELGKRDIVRMPYFNMPYQLYGLGVGHMTEKLQDEVDTLHNIRVNSQHLSSLQGFVTRSGSTHLDNFEFTPLFNLKTESPKEDVIQMTFPDVSQSTFIAEDTVTQYADRYTGAGNAMMGQPDDQAKTRATASGTMFLAKQGYKMYDSISKNIEEAYGEIGLMIVYQLVANPDRTRNTALHLVGAEDQQLIEDILEMNVEDIPTKFDFKIQVTEPDKTEEAKLQKWMTLQQLYSTYVERTASLAEKIFMVQQQAPQLAEPLMKLYTGQTKIMQEIIDNLTDKDPDDFTVYIKDLELMLQQQEMAKDRQVSEVKDAINRRQEENPVALGYAGGTGGRVGVSSVPQGNEGNREAPSEETERNVPRGTEES